jgi:hypothetical protein
MFAVRVVHVPATLLAVPPRAATVCGAPASRGVAGFERVTRERLDIREGDTYLESILRR